MCIRDRLRPVADKLQFIRQAVFPAYHCFHILSRCLTRVLHPGFYSLDSTHWFPYPAAAGAPDTVVQATSNSPAAPMPPPTHMVMTTYFTPRRLPSINAWPIMRDPLMP